MNRQPDEPTLYSELTGMSRDQVDQLIARNKERQRVIRAVEGMGARLDRRMSKLEQDQRQRQRRP